MKKALVTDPLEPVVSYEELAKAPPEGRPAQGFVTRITAGGLVVTFFNNVHGLVSARTLLQQGSAGPPFFVFIFECSEWRPFCLEPFLPHPLCHPRPPFPLYLFSCTFNNTKGVDDINVAFSLGQTVRCRCLPMAPPAGGGASGGASGRLSLCLDVPGSLGAEGTGAAAGPPPPVGSLVGGSVLKRDLKAKGGPALTVVLDAPYGHLTALLPLAHVRNPSTLASPCFFQKCKMKN